MASKDLPLVMIWRQVSNLEAAKASTEQMLHLPLIGREEDRVMYDAGSVILAFWGQEEAEEFFAVASEKLATAGDAGSAMRQRFLNVANQCGGMNLSRVPLVINPAVNTRFATGDIAGPGGVLSSEGGGGPAPTAQDELGESLPFYDDDGNLYSLSALDSTVAATLGGPVGERLGHFLEGHQPERGKLAVTTLMVTNVVKSAEFYREVLGLEQLGVTNGVASFDVGASILRLAPEPTTRTVRSLFRAGRLNGDWLVFHTGSIRRTVSRLERKGVKFPLGIEESATGRLAYFTDPDGIALVLWDPPSNETLPEGYINFFPVLNRILQQA